MDPELALSRAEASLSLVPDCPYHLVNRAIAIQLLDREDGPSLEDALRSLERAHELDPGHIEALQELAHFFDAVAPDETKATHFARLCLEQVQKVSDEMSEILTSR